MIDQHIRQRAVEAFSKYPSIFSEDTKSRILEQKIVPGMTPYEAQLAGGSFTFIVKADPKRWKKDADPLLVIETQSVDPDDSEISLTFKNDTQFPDQGRVAFRVDFTRGRVTGIVVLK